MLTGKQKRMAEFYRQCLDKGYTDMRDDVQSLKAKVIAVDLGLNYGNIVSFYEEAKRAWEIDEAERLAEEKRAREEASRQAAAAARKAVDGQLLITLSTAKSKNLSGAVHTLRCYLRPDGSFYYTYNGGEKIEGYPDVFAEKGAIVETTYHPSQTVYTGATVGGVTTGGFHQTKASTSERVRSTDKGDIRAKVGKENFKINSAVPSDYVCGLFRRDSEFNQLVTDGMIVCWKLNSNASVYTGAMAHGGADYATMLNLANYALDAERLPYSECRRIMALLNRIIKGVFPDSDETVYQRAILLSDSDSSKELKKALDGFRSLSGYRDADERARIVGERYEEVLQGEKERAILEKERLQEQRRVSRKKNGRTALIVILALIACFTLLSKVILPRARYARAEQLYAAGDYGAAAELYKKLGHYEDSAAKWADAAEKHTVQLREQQRASAYERALKNLQSGNYEKAAEQFAELGDYEDSEAKLLEARYQLAVQLKAEGKLGRASEIFTELGGYKDSAALLAEAGSQIEEAQKERDYNEAVSLLAYGEKVNPDKIAEARELLRSLSGYKDAKELLSKILYRPVRISRSNGESRLSYDSQGFEIGSVPSERYTFDAQGRVVAENSNIGRYIYTYNDAGLLVQRHLESTLKGYSNEVTLSYDGNGRLRQSQEVGVQATKKETATGTFTDTITTTTTTSYSYNAQGLPAAVTKEEVRVVNYESDNYRKTEKSSETTKYKYDAQGRVVKTTTPDWITTTEYDAQGRIASRLEENLRLNQGAHNRLVRYVYSYDGDVLTVDSIDGSGNKHRYETVYYGYIYAPNHVESNVDTLYR